MNKKQEHKNIQLELGDTSFEKKLGIYYIDFTNSLVHYTSGLKGDVDENGIPMTGWGKNATYAPINISQYALLQHGLWLKEKKPDNYRAFKNCIHILDKIKTTERNAIVWRHNYRNKKYDLKTGWVSAMAQGLCISVFLRAYQTENDPYYLEIANRAYDFLKIPITDDGVRYYDDEGFLWLEEYPDSPPIHVLNGFIYALFGLVDLYRVSKRDDVKSDMDACFNTLKNKMEDFDTGFWTFYDLRYKELVRYYYQKNVHVLQVKALFKLTRDDFYNYIAIKWTKQLTYINYVWVSLLYRLKNRTPRLYRFIISLWKN